jgi:UDP-glucuronate 4-epimerase
LLPPCPGVAGMRVVVTGAAGFIGSHLSERLLEAGHDVVGVDGFVETYPASVKRRNLVGPMGWPRFHFVEADLRTADLVAVIADADAVVHLAAAAGLMRSWQDFELYETCNILAVHRLLEAIRTTGVQRLVHVSTSSVYGTDAVGDESLPLRPVSPYGVTKLAAEQLIRAYGETYDLPWVVLRYFSIFGPRQRPDMGYHLFAEALLDGRVITVFGDGRQSRSNTYITDCVTGTAAALDGAHDGEVYNIGGGEEIDVLAAIEALADSLDVEPRIEHGPPRPGDQRRTVADCSKAAAHFGYRPSVGAREGLALQAAWHRDRRSLEVGRS